MQGINSVILMGHLGADPELRQTANGKTLCRLRLATNRSWRRGEEWVEETEWHDVVLWDLRAESANRRASKGSLCVVEGRLTSRSWEDAQGQRRKSVEVVGQRVTVVSPRPEAGRSASVSLAGGGSQGARSHVALPPALPDPPAVHQPCAISQHTVQGFHGQQAPQQEEEVMPF